MKLNLKLGFIGGATNSTIGKIHYISSKLDDRWKLVSGCFSRNKKINFSTGNYYNVEKKRIYSDLSSFIKYEKGNIDAVVVLTPTPNHSNIVKKLLKNNFAIICEKPLVENFNEIISIKKLIKKHTYLRVTYNYTGYPMIRELKHMIERNYLGKVNQLNFEMPQDSFTRSTKSKISPKQWRLKDRKNPNICSDLASHLYNLSYFLIKYYPTKVMTNYFSNSKYKKIIDNAYFWLKYKSSINANYWISKTATGIRNGLKIRILGEKKSAYWYQMRPEELYILNNDGSSQIFDRGSRKLVAHKKRYNRYKSGHPSGFIEAFANLYSDLADDLINHKKGKYKNIYTFDFYNSLEISKFFKASNTSNKKKSWSLIK